MYTIIEMTNLADNSLHSLNMGEVRHVCWLEMEQTLKTKMSEIFGQM